MDIDLEAMDCTEDAFAPKGKSPLTLQDVGTERILNRRILRCDARGSYGTGGTGFFGILLEGDAHYPQEWLILALFGSHGWLLLNGERLDTLETIKKIPVEPIFALLCNTLGRLSFILLPVLAIQRGLAQLVRPLWDEVWRKLVESEIYAVEITESKTSIKIKRGKEKTYLLEVPQPGPYLPNGNRWIIKANHLKAWKISRSGKIYC